MGPVGPSFGPNLAPTFQPATFQFDLSVLTSGWVPLRPVFSFLFAPDPSTHFSRVRHNRGRLPSMQTALSNARRTTVLVRSSSQSVHPIKR
jgi:hypothetical protein